jgi:hypothetical protein
MRAGHSAGVLRLLRARGHVLCAMCYVCCTVGCLHEATHTSATPPPSRLFHLEMPCSALSCLPMLATRWTPPPHTHTHIPTPPPAGSTWRCQSARPRPSCAASSRTPTRSGPQASTTTSRACRTGFPTSRRGRTGFPSSRQDKAPTRHLPGLQNRTPAGSGERQRAAQGGTGRALRPTAETSAAC